MKRLFLYIFIFLIVSCARESNKVLRLSPLFTDHMVVQQQDTIVVSGETMAQGQIQVKASWGSETVATADDRGLWKSTLHTPAAGGPHTIEFSTGDTTVTIQDVYVGEVWLASGQSNMEMPLSGWPPNDTINFSAREIRDANDPLIRMFTVGRAVSDTLMPSVKGSWETCSSETAPDFSATAYFFARKLRQELNVPVGIVHSSWGGTPAEAWVSSEGLKPLGDFDEALKQMSITPEERKRIRKWVSGLKTVYVSPGELASFNLEDELAASASLNHDDWLTMALPRLWEQSAVGEYDGIVWFRKEIIIDNPSGDYILSLGPIDDMDITYVNGKEVGRYDREGFWQADRVYTIPEGTLTNGKNVIALKVIDTRGGGGIYGSPEKMYLEGNGKKISMAGDWKYLPVGEYRDDELYLYGVEDSKYKERPKSLGNASPHQPTMLYNAMIHPLMDYTFKGAIWYQGESNVGRAEQYERLFPALIQDWRRQNNSTLPFYFVQIAPYVYGDAQSAALRDAQRKTLSLPNTGMVVTLDIGNNTNIHPGNKQDVGSRLARWALANDYKVSVPYSGPLVREAKAEGARVVVTFDHGEGLVLKGSKPYGVELAGEDGQFYPADAIIDGDRLVVSSSRVRQPRTVRYAWTNTATATLFNAHGLPASSFSVPVGE